MALTDYNLADQSGGNFRSELNTILSILVANNSHATTPTTTFPYMFWADTTSGILKQRNAADSAWINLWTLAGGAPGLTDANTFTGVNTFNGGLTMGSRLTFKTGADIASATTTDISGSTGNIIHITGTTTITAWTMTSGQIQEIIFDGILQLTHHATTNKLLTGANITTEAGDMATYHYDGTTVRMIDYQRLSGASLAGGLQTKFGSMSWDISTTGTQAVTGVGFTPKGLITFVAGTGSTKGASWGLADDSTSGWSITDFYGVTAGNYGYAGTFLSINTSVGVQSNLQLTSMDADGFTVTKVIGGGSPTGTYMVIFLAIG